MYQTARFCATLCFCPGGWECWIWGASHYGNYLRCFFSLEIQKCDCSLQQQLVFLLPPSLLPVVHMETNTDVFKAFHLKYLLKSVQLGALSLPLLCRLYTKQVKKSLSGILDVMEILFFLPWGRFRIFSLNFSLGHLGIISALGPGQMHPDFTSRGHPWSLRCCCWSQSCAWGCVSAPGVLLCLCPSDALVIAHIIKNGRQVLPLFWSPAEDGCTFTSPSFCRSLTGSFLLLISFT